MVARWLLPLLAGVGLGGAALFFALRSPELGIAFFLLLLLLAVALLWGELQKLLLALVILEIPIQLDKSYFYNEEAASFSALGGLNISLTTLCLGLLYGLWVAELLAQPTRTERTVGRLSVNWAPFLYVAVTFVSITVASDRLLALFEINLLLQALLIFLYVALRVRRSEDVRFVLLMLGIGLGLQSCIAIGLALRGEGFTVGSITARIDYGVRVGGTVGSPNSAASYFTLLLATTLGGLLTPLARWWRWGSGALFVLGTLAILLTLSRGGLVGYAISVGCFAFVAWRLRWISLKLPLYLGGFFLLLALVYSDLWWGRFFGADDSAAALSRLPLMRLAFAMILDHPLLGVGANNFAAAWAPYLTPDISHEWIHTVHNKYLLVWAETGIVGLGAFLAFLLGSLERGWQIVTTHDPFLAPVALGLMAGIIGQMVHMQVDIFTGRPQVQMLWLVAGLLTAMSRLIIAPPTTELFTPSAAGARGQAW